MLSLFSSEFLAAIPSFCLCLLVFVPMISCFMFVFLLSFILAFSHLSLYRALSRSLCLSHSLSCFLLILSDCARSYTATLSSSFPILSATAFAPLHCLLLLTPILPAALFLFTPSSLSASLHSILGGKGNDVAYQAQGVPPACKLWFQSGMQAYAGMTYYFKMTIDNPSSALSAADPTNFWNVSIVYGDPNNLPGWNPILPKYKVSNSTLARCKALRI